jgi:hypothetical protein
MGHAPTPQARVLPPLLVGPVNRNDGFKTVLVYCLGAQAAAATTPAAYRWMIFPTGTGTISPRTSSARNAAQWVGWTPGSTGARA